MVHQVGLPHINDVPNFGFRISLHALTIFLALLTTISLPSLVTLDIARIDFNSSLTSGINEIRLGIWSYCVYENMAIKESCHIAEQCRRTCSDAAYGYSVNLTIPSTTETLHLNSSHARSLAVHCAALVALLLSTALLLARRPNIWVDRAVILILIISSITDGVFFGRVEHVSAWDLSQSKPDVSTGPGLWSAAAALVVFIVALCASSDADDHHKALLRRKEMFFEENASLLSDEQEKSSSSVVYNTDHDCPTCWESKKRLYIIVPCGHIICQDCYVANSSQMKRCPFEDPVLPDQCPERLRPENMILVRPVDQEIL